MTIPKFYLHSSSDNWFHFRKDLKSMMGSFSITYIHDGTVVMTGDYGSLAWRREWFSGRTDYGFPSIKSGIGYFAEKVVRAEDSQKIRVWKKSQATEELEKMVKNEDEEWSESHINTFKFVLDKLNFCEDGEYGHIQMMEAFSEKGDLDLEDYSDIGMDFTDIFKWKYEIATSVSDLIMSEVNNRLLVKNDMIFANW